MVLVGFNHMFRFLRLLWLAAGPLRLLSLLGFLLFGLLLGFRR